MGFGAWAIGGPAMAGDIPIGWGDVDDKTSGEIGVVKRDIVFSGDVLNTTARIEQKCNELGVNILLSNYLLDKLNLQTNTFEPKKIGDMELRGKEQKVMLYTL